jgi:hypothetical protein
VQFLIITNARVIAVPPVATTGCYGAAIKPSTTSAVVAIRNVLAVVAVAMVPTIIAVVSMMVVIGVTPVMATTGITAVIPTISVMPSGVAIMPPSAVGVISAGAVGVMPAAAVSKVTAMSAVAEAPAISATWVTSKMTNMSTAATETTAVAGKCMTTDVTTEAPAMSDER